MHVCACRYYLAPEAGGVGIASSGSALHDLASDLAKRSAAPTREGSASEGRLGGHAAGAAEQSTSTTPPAEAVNPAAIAEVSSVESWSSDSDGSEGSDVLDGDMLGEDAQRDSGAADGDGQSAEGYFDAAATAKPALSVFGIAWRLLGIWVCQASVLHLHKPDVQCAHCFPEDTRQVRTARCNLLPLSWHPR